MQPGSARQGDVVQPGGGLVEHLALDVFVEPAEGVADVLAHVRVETGRMRHVGLEHDVVFAEDLDPGRPEVVVGLLNDAGLDGPAMVERTQEQAIKDELKANTDGAIALGVFGAPTCVVDGRKKFWGHDRFPLMEHYLKNA